MPARNTERPDAFLGIDRVLLAALGRLVALQAKLAGAWILTRIDTPVLVLTAGDHVGLPLAQLAGGSGKSIQCETRQYLFSSCPISGPHHLPSPQ